VLLSCYQSVLSTALNGIGRQRASARNSLLCGAIQLAVTYVTVGRPEWGLKGYVAGFVSTSALGVLLNWLCVAAGTGLKPRIFTWLTAPALAALLSGLCSNLLFHCLLDRGLAAVLSAISCTVFGLVLYLAALQAQGVSLIQSFRPGK